MKMKGYMMMSVCIPIEVSDYVETIDPLGRRVPKGADRSAEQELSRMIDDGNVQWEWEWEDK